MFSWAGLQTPPWQVSEGREVLVAGPVVVVFTCLV